jgi:hypothetical protein
VVVPFTIPSLVNKAPVGILATTIHPVSPDGLDDIMLTTTARSQDSIFLAY